MNKEKQHTVVFVHIPKTAGSTLFQIIRRQYPDEALFTFGKDAPRSYREFQESDIKKRSSYHMVRGHIPYGIHEYIEGPCAYFTFLRDPIERTISHYYFLASLMSYPLDENRREGFTPLMDHLEFGLDNIFFNAYTRMLSGVWYDAEPGECTTEHLDLAKDNLRRHFKVVGLTERFDVSLMLLQDAFSWKSLHYYPANVAKNRPTRDDLSADLLSLVERANRLDKELYAFGRELFFDSLEGKEDRIEQRVRRFRRSNRLYKLLFPKVDAIRQRSVRAYIRRRWLSKMS